MTSISLLDRKATVTAKSVPEYYIADEKSVYPLSVDDRKRAKAMRKLNMLIIGIITVLFAFGALLGALNTYATSIEVNTMKMERETRLLDERIMEMRGTLYTQYNSLLNEMPITSPEMDKQGYFVKDNWEVGG